MGKWGFLILFALVVYLAVKATKRKNRAKSRVPPLAEDMVACAHCGVNLPKSEAIPLRGSFFCCKDHGVSG